MAKMFYSIEEAAEKLNVSTDQVREMASRGQLQEFRDRDRLMFKREQVDLLAGGGDDDIIPLAESDGLEPLTLASSGSGVGVAGGEKDSTGISIFEADATDEADANAVTRVSNSPGSFVDPGDKSASGSGGLLDLTREGDDTSLGANLLEDVYGSETVANQTAAEPAIGGDGLFESAPGADAGEAIGAGAMAAGGMLVAEPFDGTWSGIAGGLAVGASFAMIVGLAAMVLSLTTPTGGLVSTFGDNFMILVGVMFGVLLLCAGIGFAFGRKS
jgi:excisionase family DNA binding protein